MVFADIPEQKSVDFEPIRFTKLVSGNPVRLRILNKEAHRVFKHYLPQQRISIVCLGAGECPVCIENQKKVDNAPAGTRYGQIKGYISRQNRYLVNVLNKTLVKETPTGNIIFAQMDGQFPMQDVSTGEMLVNIEPKPLHRVEVLERGPTLFSQLNAINSAVFDPETNEPVGLWNYDIVITATGQGRQMTTNIIPYPQYNEPVEVSADDLYVLKDVPLQLSAAEVYEVLRGVSLQDVFAARKGVNEEAVDTDLEKLEGDSAKEASESLNAIFNEGSS